MLQNNHITSDVPALSGEMSSEFRRTYKSIPESLIQHEWQRELISRIHVCDSSSYSSAIFLHSSGEVVELPCFTSVVIPVHLTAQGNEALLQRYLAESGQASKLTVDISDANTFEKILSECRKWSIEPRPEESRFTLTSEEESQILKLYIWLTQCPELCSKLVEESNMYWFIPREDMDLTAIYPFSEEWNGFFAAGKIKYTAYMNGDRKVMPELILEELWHAVDDRYSLSGTLLPASETDISKLQDIYVCTSKDSISEDDLRDLKYLHIPAYFQNGNLYQDLKPEQVASELLAKSATILTFRGREQGSYSDGLEKLKSSPIFSKSDYLMRLLDYMIELRAEYLRQSGNS